MTTFDNIPTTIDGTQDTNNGAAVKLIGDGTITPKKYYRVHLGTFEFLNDAYQVIGQLTDNGIWTTNTVIQNNSTSGVLTAPVSSSNLSSWASTALGITIYQKYLSKNYQSGVKINSTIWVKNCTIGQSFQVALYRSYTSIPAAGQPPSTGDSVLASTPVFIQNDSNYITIPLEFLDVGNNTSNQYYYIAIIPIGGGTVTANNYGAHMMGSVT